MIAGVRGLGDAPPRPKAGAEIHELLLDVTEPGDPALLGERVRGLLGVRPLAAIVNNAGIGVGGPLEFVSVDDLRRQFEVNVIGQIAVTQAMLPLLREHGAARIIFVSSVGSRVAAPFFGPYSASKRALNAVADAWRIELAPFNIGVSVLIVPPVATPIWTKAASTLGEFRAQLSPTGSIFTGRRSRRSPGMSTRPLPVRPAEPSRSFGRHATRSSLSIRVAPTSSGRKPGLRSSSPASFPLVRSNRSCGRACGSGVSVRRGFLPSRSAAL